MTRSGKPPIREAIDVLVIGTDRSRRMLLVVAVGLICASSLALGRTVTVGRSGCNYTSVQRAINASRSGDTVLVRPGTYYEFLVLKSGVSVVADSSGEVVLYSTFAPVVSAQNVSSGRVSGFVLEYAGTWKHNAVWIVDSSVEISNNKIRGGTYSGIHVDGSATPVIEGNTITGSTGNGVYLAANTRATVRENRIEGNGGSGIHVRDNAEPEISGNVICSNAENGIFSCGDSSGRVLNNEISENGHKGIYVLENAAPFIDGNTIFGNTQEGISVVCTSKVTASNNDIHDNQWAGVFAGETAKLLLHGNTIYRNHEAVCVGDEAEVAITGNVLYENEHSGIIARNSSSIYVEANSIRSNAAHGISASNSAAGDLYDNQIANNGLRGVHVAGTADLDIRSNTISGNGREGIGVVRTSRFPQGSDLMEVTSNDIYDHPHAGIFLGKRSDLIIAQNTIHGNFEGICVSDEVEVDIESNSIYENRDVGVEIREDAFGLFSNNTIRNNEKSGIHAWGAASGEICDNQITGSGQKGIYITETADFVIRRNEISGNAHEGVSIVGSIQRTASDNEIRANGFAGIFVGETASAILTDNTITENLREGICVAGDSTATIRGNLISSNVYVGIRMQDSATGIIQDNMVSSNAEHGIFAIGSSGGEVSGNTIRENLLYGIFVQNEASPSIGENVLSGNGRGTISIRGSEPPGVVAIDCPSTIPIEPLNTAIAVTFHDSDANLQTAKLEVVEGDLADFVVDLTQPPYAEQVSGVVDGVFEIEIAVPEPGSYRLRITLVNSTGLENSPTEFAFQAFTPHAPAVLTISATELIEIPQKVDGLVQYEDSDGDITQARFEVLDGALDDFALDLTQSPYVDQVTGLAEGEFAFEIVPEEPGSYRIQVTLVDATGLEGEPFEFSFEAYTPTPPAVDRITFPASIDIDQDQNGLVRFEDPDGDIVEAQFEIIEGDASTIVLEPGLSFDPEVEGETDGAFRFTVHVTQAQTVTLQLILVDAAGLESKSVEFTFDVR